MKKTILLAALFAAITAQAASFTWGTGTVSVTFDGTKLAGNATAYLVYLGTSTDTSALFSTTDEAIVGADYVTSQATSTAVRTAGRVSNSYSSTDIVNGAVYGAYIKYNDGEKDWFNFSSVTYTVSGVSLGTEALTADTFTFDFDTKTEVKVASGEKPSAGGGWFAAAVPEPSVAIMGLLGIGMLIRRRKA